jgi:hypothetical protein
MKKVTVQEVIDAIRQNGLKKAKLHYWRTRSGKALITGYPTNYDEIDRTHIGAGCAIGQAALNLDVNPQYLYRSLNTIRVASGRGLGLQIVELNDATTMPLPRIADKLELGLSDEQKQKILEIPEKGEKSRLL